MSLRLAVWAVALGCALSACDGEPPIIPLDGSRRDAGRRDSGGFDAGGRDAGMRADAGPLTCSAALEDVHKLGSDDGSRTDRIVGLAAGGNAFGLAWNGTPGEEPPPADILARRLPTSGAIGAEQTLTTGSATRYAPAIVPVGSSWLAAWVDNSSDTAEVRTRALGADAAGSGDVHSITSNATAFEQNPTLFSGSESVMLAWVDEDTLTLNRIVRAIALGDDGTPSGGAQIASNAAHRPGQIALAELNDGPVLLYASSADGMSRLYLQPLDATGAMMGEAQTIDSEMNAEGAVDAALTSSGGAIVFGTLTGARPEVRFRAMGGGGALLGDERILAEGSGASIAYFAGGFAVSYRAPAVGDEAPSIRVLLVNDVGDVALDVFVSEAELEGGRTTVRVSGDGQIGVAWADGAGLGVDFSAALVRCQGGG